MEFSQSNDHMDKRFSWVIAFAAAFNNFIVVGMMKSVGMFYIAMYQTFGISRDMATFISVTCSGLLHATGVLSTVLLFKFGYRPLILFGVCFASFGTFLSYFAQTGTHLLLTFGVIQGIGIGISSTPNMSITSQYFIKHRAKASGLLFAGCSLGSCVFPPFIEYLLEEYGLRGTLLIMSGISLNTLVSSLMIKDPPTLVKRRRQSDKDQLESGVDETSMVETKENNYSEAESPCSDNPAEGKSKNVITAKELVLSTFKSGFFYAVVVTAQAPAVALVYFHTIMPDQALTMGISIQNAAYLISITSIADLCGRMTIGIFIDKNILQVCNSYALSLILAGALIFTIGFNLTSSYAVLATLCAFYGIAYGSTHLHMPVVVSHYLSPEKVPVVISSFSLISVILIFSLAPVSTHFYETYGNYSGIYFVMAALFTLPAIGWFYFGFVSWCKAKKPR